MAETKINKYLDYDGLVYMWSLLRHKIENESVHVEKTYNDALLWAKVPGNAAVGQIIYIKEQQTVISADGTSTTYISGPYVINSLGDNTKLSPLSQSSAGDPSMQETVNNLEQHVNNNIYTKEESEKLTEPLSTSEIDDALNKLV